MESGTQVGPYRIDSLLGRGGMAEVYRVWHGGLHRWEALKILPPEMTFDRSFVERFLQEARTAAGLQHPHIATIHSVSDASGPQYYFAMELVEGGDLGDLLASRGRLPLHEALAILQQIGEALDFAHSRGIVHRDVKPGNVLLGSDSRGGGMVKVVDFGIARAQEGESGTRLTRTGMMIGTPEYMSPEQAGSGARVDHRSDIYSLGVIAYEMLCGQPPFRAKSDTSALSVIMSHVRDMPRPPVEHDPSLPPAVNNAILKALAKHPAERFHSCADFMEAVSGQVVVAAPLAPAPMVIGHGTPAPTVTLPAAAGAMPKRTPQYLLPILTIIAVFFGIGLIAAGLFLHKETPTATLSTDPNPTPGDSNPNIQRAQVKTPKVVAESVKDAIKTLERRSLKLVSTDTFDESVTVGDIVSQDPKEGELIDSGGTVHVKVSTGPRPVRVPDVVGSTGDEAESKISESGLKSDTTEETSSTVSKDVVISQRPSPGTMVRHSRMVHLVVSSGPDQSNPEVDTEVRAMLDSWGNATRNHDLNTQITFYADQLTTYYDRTDVSKELVRQREEKDFSQYSIVHNWSLSDISVTPEGSDRATVHFQKDWDIGHPGGKDSSGSETQEMEVEKIGGEWKIVAEHEPHRLG